MFGLSLYIISQNMMEINRDSLFCVKEPFLKLFHRIVKEKPCAERAGKSLLTGEGNTSRRKPFYANTPSPATTSRHTPAPFPRNSARIPARFLNRRSPPVSAPIRSAIRYGSRYGSAHTPEVTRRRGQPIFRQ